MTSPEAHQNCTRCGHFKSIGCRVSDPCGQVCCKQKVHHRRREGCLPRERPEAVTETCPGKDTHKRILAKLSKEDSGVEGDRWKGEEPGFPWRPAPRAAARPAAEPLKHIRSRPAISLAHLPWLLTVKSQPPPTTLLPHWPLFR